MKRRSIVAVALAMALLATACHDKPDPQPDPLTTPIIDRAVASQRQARLWAGDFGAPAYWLELVPTFWQVAEARGLRPDAFFALSSKETRFGTFPGVVSATFKNPCGLKVAAGGPNEDPNAHAQFPNWTTGIRACADHLALYAGAPGYPRANSPDPRHFPQIAGTATTYQQLGGRWAPNPGYGTSIVHDYLLHMIFDYR